MKRFIVIASCALVLASCRGNANNVVLSSLDRSEKIQLLCADLELITGNLFDLRQVLPNEICSTETTFAPEVEAQFLGAVTQTQTGEVAVVSFTRSAILDTNRTVPGVTALRVGEQPTGIQISPVGLGVMQFSGSSMMFRTMLDFLIVRQTYFMAKCSLMMLLLPLLEVRVVVLYWHFIEMN